MSLLTIFISSQELNEYIVSDFKFVSSLEFDEIKEIADFTTGLNNNLNNLLKLDNNSDKRTIVILSDYDNYAEYLKEISVPVRKDYSYLRFNIQERDRVVLYLGDELNMNSLAHHLTLQYLDFYGRGAPEWFNLGIATFYEDFTMENGLESSHKWVNTIKSSNESIISVLTKSDNRKMKQAVSWLVIDYLINTDNKSSNRFFWDTLSYLKYSDDDDKEIIIEKSFFELNLESSLKNYLTSLKGYIEYMESGLDYYNNNKFEDAINEFKKASDIELNKYSPRYYLGICYSKTERYKMSYSEFSKAIDLGAPKDITFYSIGVNFYQEKEYKQAMKYLKRITELDNSNYSDKAIKLINEIKKY